MQLYIIRHADPDYSIDGLTEFGHKEAAALGVRIAAAGLERLYASPLGRAQLTAGYIAKETGLKVETEPWTCELDWAAGMPDGRRAPIWDYPGEQIPELHEGARRWGDDTDLWLSREEFRHKYSDLKEASDQFFARHGYVREGGRYRIEFPSTERIAVVCHGGIGMAWLAHLLQLPLSVVWSVFWLAPSSVTTVLFEERSQTFAVPRCLAMGDTSHLYAGGMNVRPRGLIANHR
jgi:probable phosphoglycerate mutase